MRATNLKQRSQSVPEISCSKESDGREFIATLTFDQQILISLSLNPRRVFLNLFLFDFSFKSN